MNKEHNEVFIIAYGTMSVSPSQSETLTVNYTSKVSIPRTNSQGILYREVSVPVLNSACVTRLTVFLNNLHLLKTPARSIQR